MKQTIIIISFFSYMLLILPGVITWIYSMVQRTIGFLVVLILFIGGYFNDVNKEEQ